LASKPDQFSQFDLILTQEDAFEAIDQLDLY
jgi:hypothetical protein